MRLLFPATFLALLLTLVGFAQQPPTTTSTQPQAQTSTTAQPKAPAPAIVRTEFERRLAELRKQHDQAVSDVHALEGAIQDCEFWLKQLEAAEKAAAESAKTPKPDKPSSQSAPR